MKNCQISGKAFDYSEGELNFINSLEFKFGDKSFKLPIIDISPDERLRQRVSYRNEQNMYWNKSAIDGTPILSIYSPDKPCKIYPQSYWFSDKWDPLTYGRDYDFSRGFFEQFYELSLAVPKANMVTVSNENSDYSTGTGYCKNCYLINSSEYVEDSYYGKLLQTCKNIVDSSYIYNSEICYECFNLRKCYDCYYVYNSQNTSCSYFSDNLTGCKNCFLCTNLTNKEYYYENNQLSKDEYEEKKKQFFGSYSAITRAKQIFDKLRENRIYKYTNIINGLDCTGDFIRDSKSCDNCYDITDCEDCSNLQVGFGCKDVHSSSNAYVSIELCSNILGVFETYNCHFSLYLFTCSDILYSENMYSSKNCFGCSGLRNKEYCILNKQYTKEEYNELVTKIIEHMISAGEWGSFFPSKYSHFAYNETVASDYLPLTKDDVISRGLKWKDSLGIIPEAKEQIQASGLPETISEVDDSILKKAVICEVSKRPYKITEQELKFYRQHNLPLPHLHPDERHKLRMKLRKERKLYDRACMKCGKEVKSPYSLDSKETIYCESCYLKEVY